MMRPLSAIHARWAEVQNAFLVQLGQQLVKAGLKLQGAVDGEGEYARANREAFARLGDHFRREADADHAIRKAEGHGAVGEEDGRVRCWWVLGHDQRVRRFPAGGQS
ncbi:hypothetical protein [Brevundimonas sp. A19_0]|uniref:hypothetical protein n=1 Tax=Brevundimonas sp. A19_0 TaxID=2821087 RepID=UPI001ADBA1F9|nr:hypothetical protein [Brevundimonas sp. A19_0]MBO9502041.1 hypothetical protein [Brevundimonas sp. A19_0]